MLPNQNFIMEVFVGKDTGANQTSAAGAKITSAVDGQILDGELYVLDRDNAVCGPDAGGTNEVTDKDKVRIVQRKGSQLKYSDWMYINKMRSYRGQTDTAATDQITYIGYNGTSGSLDVLDNNEYTVKIASRHSQRLNSNKDFYHMANFVSSSSATEAEVGLGLAQELWYNTYRKEGNQSYVRYLVDLVNSATVTAANGFKNTQTVSVTQYSKVIVCTTDVTYEAAGGETLVVGDYVRIGSVGGGTALTDPVYRVESISGVNVTLDRPVTAATGALYTAVDGTSDIEVIPAATAIAANFGLKITGQERPNWRPGVFTYFKEVFDVYLDGFELTGLTYSQDANEGTGQYEQIAELEHFCYGNRGKVLQTQGVVPQTYTLDAESGSAYDMIVIEHWDESHPTPIGGSPQSHKTIVVAIETGFADGESPDDFIDVLDDWAVDNGFANSGIGV